MGLMDLQQFEAAMAAIRDGKDLGNSLHDALVQTTIDMDGDDFARAILTLNLEELTPFLVIWRRELIREILEETHGPAFYYVTEKVKEIEPL